MASSSAAASTPPGKPIRTHWKTPEGVYFLSALFSHTLGKVVPPPLPGRHPRLSLVSCKPTPNDGVGTDATGEETTLMPLGNTYVLFNMTDTLYLYDYISDKEPLQSVRFRFDPVCHAFNKATASNHSIDLVVGLANGDVQAYNIFDKSNRILFNKDGLINPGRVTVVTWVPSSRTQFLAAYSDGNLFLCDREKEEQPLPGPAKDLDKCFVVVHQPRRGRFNPLCRWHVAQSAIYDIQFAPCGRYFATVGRDGYLRVFDLGLEKLLMTQKSFYGALLCVCWSPDSQYIVTGGEDDFVTIWSFRDRKIVARGQGHQSWVSSVSFDPHVCSDGMYRFASVGQDAQLLLWDFAIETLHVPRRVSSGLLRGGDVSPPVRHPPTSPPTPSLSALELPSLFSAPPPPPIGAVPVFEPITAHRVHHDPLTAVQFLENAIVTTCQGGQTRVWERPRARDREVPSSQSTGQVSPVPLQKVEEGGVCNPKAPPA